MDSEEHERAEIEHQGNVDIEVKRLTYSTISVHNTSRRSRMLYMQDNNILP